jgi:hypothetical protein
MNLRTYEILAKWIAKTHHVRLEFQPDVCPQADVKNNTITLPSNIKEENVFGALAQLMHEAAHLNYTKKDIPEDLVKDQLSHSILNAIEDVRIDRKNFSLLPNIQEFYRRGVKYDVEERERKIKEQGIKVPLHKKVLINTIYELEDLGEGHINDKEAEEFAKKHKISEIFWDSIQGIEYKDWPKVKNNVEKLIKIFGLDKLPRIPLGGGKGIGIQCPECKGTGTAKGSSQPCPVCGGKGTIDADLSDLMGSKNVFGSRQGHGSAVGNQELVEVATEELTKMKFKEILNIKEIRKIEDGNKINTDNLASFLTGDIDSLMEEEIIRKVKKSKIILLLDASGSMGSGLLDNSKRSKVVTGCGKSLIDILNEVCMLEGLNVDYEIVAFDDDYKVLSKENWENEYRLMGGGTNLINAFSYVQDKLLQDMDIDGNRIIIVFTDGEVSEQEINLMHNRILSHGTDIRCMVIGVGADITGTFVRDIVGDMNILAHECADSILLEAIMTCLEIS